MNLRKIKYISNLDKKRLYLKSKIVIMSTPTSNNRLYEKWLEIDTSNMNTLNNLPLN